MGLITGLLTLPLAPVRGVGWIAEVLAEQADQELAAAQSPQRKLADIDLALARGDITAEEAEELAAGLLEER